MYCYYSRSPAPPLCLSMSNFDILGSKAYNSFTLTYGCVPIYRQVNHDFFKTWSPVMAYVLGYIEADGAITQGKRGNQYLDLYSIDYQLLNDVRTALKSNHKISTRNSNPHFPNRSTAYRLQIGSTSIISDLQELGLSVAKSHRLVMPNVPSQYVGDFIRGYFDGDGNVAYTTIIRKDRKSRAKHFHCAFTSCSYNFLKQLRELLQRNGLTGGSLYFSQKAHRLLFGLHDSLKLRLLMYKKKYILCLKRKRSRFEKAIQQYFSVSQ